MRNIPDHDLSAAIWHKSSYSGGGGGDCLEVARWRKSTYSEGGGGNCLEVAEGHPTHIPVRDSKTPSARSSCSGPRCGPCSSRTSSRARRTGCRAPVAVRPVAHTAAARPGRSPA